MPTASSKVKLHYLSSLADYDSLAVKDPNTVYFIRSSSASPAYIYVGEQLIASSQDTTYSEATTSAAGLMSASDKSALANAITSISRLNDDVSGLFGDVSRIQDDLARAKIYYGTSGSVTSGVLPVTTSSGDFELSEGSIIIVRTTTDWSGTQNIGVLKLNVDNKGSVNVVGPGSGAYVSAHFSWLADSTIVFRIEGTSSYTARVVVSPGVLSDNPVSNVNFNPVRGVDIYNFVNNNYVNKSDVLVLDGGSSSTTY